MSVRIVQGDMRQKLSEIEDESVHAIVTDPPYHLTTGKKGGSGPASVNLTSPYGRSKVGTGFMGMKWDGGDVAMQPETWSLLLRVAKPGAHLLVFSGSRTFHRVWCAVEDGGWEIRDTLMWLHGEGFPKSSNQHGDWEGWGTALKPAFEPILMARKPLVGTVGENLQKHGVGALNIDACRVPTEESLNGGAYSENRKPSESEWVKHGGTIHSYAGKDYKQPDGRWPANVLHDGSEEVVVAFPDEAGAVAPVNHQGADKFRNSYGAFSGQEEVGHFHGDSGSAARFFWCPKASREDRNEGLEDTDRQNENFHPTVKPTELMQYLIKLVTPRGGVILDPFMGSGSTGKAAVREGMSFVGIELDSQYIEIARRRISGVAPLFEVA